MSLLKKVNDAWEPSEKPNLKIGDTIEVTNYETLVKTGMAVLVDENGNELELPGQKFTCPICFVVVSGVMSLSEHLATHLKKNKQALENKVVEQNVAATIAKQETETKEVKADESKKMTRAEILAKARAARKIKK